MNITVYLPDELAQRAKEAEFNLSRLLRDAVEARFAQEEKMQQTLGAAAVVELPLHDGTIGRFRGQVIGQTPEYVVFLTEKKNVIGYEKQLHRHTIVTDPETQLASWLGSDRRQYRNAMTALGLPPIIDLDV